MLKTELLPYQLDGIAFAVGAGRAVLADDMGLGKTIQGVGVAELLAQQAGIRKVLVICPTSLKSQWRSEIERFSDRSCQLVMGAFAERPTQYDNDAFFTVCNYEQVLRDLLAVERVKWDLIILDEGQRIKNWEAKTTNVVKRLKSPFALVLSGTPLENRLDELYSVVQFVDDRRLGPAFRFFNRHRVADEKGKVLGLQEPGPTSAASGADPAAAHARTGADAIARADHGNRADRADRRTARHSRRPDEDRGVDRPQVVHQRDGLAPPAASLAHVPHGRQQHVPVQQARAGVLQQARTARRNPGTELRRERPQGGAVLRMDDDAGAGRGDSHAAEAEVRAAGWIGAAEATAAAGERISVAARLPAVHHHERGFDRPQPASGQHRDQLRPAVEPGRAGAADRPCPPHGPEAAGPAFLLVTEQTLEESLLTTLSAKKDLALATLDVDSDIDEVSLVSGAEELRSRLEILLGAKPQAPLDVSQKAEVVAAVDRQAHRERVAAAGGELLGAVFNFLGELVAQQEIASPPAPETVAGLKHRLAECVEEDGQGRQRLSITLPNRDALDNLAATLARLLVTPPQ